MDSTGSCLLSQCQVPNVFCKGCFSFCVLFLVLNPPDCQCEFWGCWRQGIRGVRSYLYHNTAIISSICVYGTGLHVLNTLHIAQPILTIQLNHDNFTVS